MTKFDINDFDMGFGSERWVTYGRDRKFIGRFKYHRPAANARAFVKFLVKNFTVEEYFHAREVENKAPGEILREKGYVSPNEQSARNSQALYARDQRPMILEVA